MKRIVIGAGATAALLAAVLLVSMRPEARVAAPVPRSLAETAPRTERLPYVPDGRIEAAAASPASMPARTRLETLARKNGGTEVSTPTAEVLSAFTTRELDLFARIARVTGRSDSQGARELVARQRAGASAEVLTAEADRLFALDPVARAAAREWIRETTGAARAGPERDVPATGQRLRRIAPASR